MFSRLIGFIFQLVGLAIIAGLGWGLFHLISFLGWKLIPVLSAVYLVFKRLASLVWINSKYFKDHSSTIDRAINPSNYRWKRVPITDRLSLIIMKGIPDLRHFTDFRSQPLPFGISDNEKTPSYLKKSLFWNIVSFSFLAYWYFYGIEQVWEYVLLGWSLFLFIGTVISRRSKNSQSLRVAFERRYLVVWLSASELVEKVSLGLVKRSLYFSRRRVKFCLLVSLIGLIISLSKILLDQYLH